MRTDAITLRALARAFDDAALYDEEARTVRGARPQGTRGARWAGLARAHRAGAVRRARHST